MGRPSGLRGAWVAPGELVVLSVPIEARRAHAGLTAAELEVVALVLDGLSNQEIATRRAVARSTVRKQLEGIYRKLGIGSRAELAALDRARPG